MSFNEKEGSISDPAMDLNAKRRAALAEVDNAKFGWFHVKACCVAGVGFFTGECPSYRKGGKEVEDEGSTSSPFLQKFLFFR